MTKNQQTLLKGALIIIAIILGCVFLSKKVLFSSQTLAERSESYGESQTSESNAEQLPSVSNSDTAEVALATPSPTADPVMEFYAMPLSEEQIAYITGCSYPASDIVPDPQILYDDLMYVHLLHYNFDGDVVPGEIICNKIIAQDIVDIFYELYLAGYQMEEVCLIEKYNGDDELSMQANNTSCFNYRVVDGSTHLSKHAYGLAIDINPFYNPYVTFQSDGTVHYAPEGSEIYADRSASFPYKIDESDLCYRLFTERGFTWGGNWNSVKDYQHFEYKIP